MRQHKGELGKSGGGLVIRTHQLKDAVKSIDPWEGEDATGLHTWRFRRPLGEEREREESCHPGRAEGNRGRHHRDRVQS